MNRPWLTWLAFAGALAVVLAALAWVSIEALRLDRAEATARRQASIEEAVRLALWRMDSNLTPIIARETARPYFAYSAFYPAERAYTAMFLEMRKGDVLVPSPLLTQASPFVLVHFQFGPDGTLTSPEAPAADPLLAMKTSTEPDRIADATRRLSELADLVKVAQLRTALPALACVQLTQPTLLAQRIQPAQLLQQAGIPPVNQGTGPVANQQPPRAGTGAQGVPAQTPAQSAAANQQLQQFDDANGDSALQQKLKTGKEYQARVQSIQQVAQSEIGNDNAYTSFNSPNGSFGNRSGGGNKDANRASKEPATGNLSEEVMRPVWLGQALLLARRVTIDGKEYVQGCWLDWHELHAWLIDNVKDLLPAATLQPVTNDPGTETERMLAALPVRLVPGDIPGDRAAEPSPIRFTLTIAWVGALLAAGAVAALLMGALSLSERRGAFVSAVTHELRTPLTTLRMYTEMLAEGMVTDPDKRQHYLETLRAEADRLGRLVENVLAYARLERGRGGDRREKVALGVLVDQVLPRLRERAGQAEMTVAVELGERLGAVQAMADPGAVDQILFNLVDNACKYAANAADKRILIAAGERAGAIVITVRDHGPGIAAAQSRRLFTPFSKSAHEAANSALGVGLGLALSRRLARRMGGDLQLEAGSGGAGFALTLPAA